MNSIESLQWRNATKKFNSKKILTATQINTLKEAFNLTPSSYGLQPVTLVIIQNKKLQKELVEYSWNQEQVAQASHVLVFCIPKNYTTKYVENYFLRVKEVRNTPDEIINPFKEFLINDIARKTQEELFLWNKNQAYLAVGNLLTICAIEQIDACPMEGFIPDKYDTLLNLKEKNLSSVLVLPVGFREDNFSLNHLKKVRKNISDSIIEIIKN